MSTETPSPGTAPGLPAHLATMQDKAMVAQALLDAACACNAAGERDALAFQLMQEARNVLREIGNGLDSVNLPKGGLQ
jgi:hypothetical protein